MKNKVFIAVAVIFLLAVILVADRHQKRGGEGKNDEGNKVRIAYNAESLTNAPVVVAFEKKYFEVHGITPEMIALKGGKEVRQAIIAGQADTGLGGFTNFMAAMAEGAPIRFIAAGASSPSFIFVRPGENIDKLSDLYGKNICVGVAGINDLIFRSTMRRENIDTEKMNFADIERAYQAAALMGKKAVDAVVVSDQDTEMMEKSGAVVLPEWESKGYARAAEPRNSLAINTDYLEKSEKTVENFLDAVADAHRLIAEQPEEAARLLAGHIEKESGGAIIHNPETIAAKWKNHDTVNLIWQDPDITLNLARVAKEIGAIEKELSVDDIFDLRFQSKLEKIQHEIYGP